MNAFIFKIEVLIYTVFCRSFSAIANQSMKFLHKAQDIFHQLLLMGDLEP